VDDRLRAVSEHSSRRFGLGCDRLASVHDGAARLDGSRPEVADDADRVDRVVVEAPDQRAAGSVRHALEAVEPGRGCRYSVVAGVGHAATALTALTVVTTAIVDEHDDAPR